MNIEGLIRQVKIRPQAYIGNLDFESLFFFISGYLYNNIESNRADEIDIKFKKDFHEWVRMMLQKKYFVKLEEGHNYLYYICHVIPDKREQVGVFFELAIVFLNTY